MIPCAYTSKIYLHIGSSLLQGLHGRAVRLNVEAIDQLKDWDQLMWFMVARSSNMASLVADLPPYIWSFVLVQGLAGIKNKLSPSPCGNKASGIGKSAQLGQLRASLVYQHLQNLPIRISSHSITSLSAPIRIPTN